LWHFVDEGKGKEGKNNGNGGTIENGLQCPEFLTWKVGNPRTRSFTAHRVYFELTVLHTDYR